jgi:hypothetical protein
MKKSAPIREVLVPETEYQEYRSFKTDNTALLQTLLEHHLYNQPDVYYHNSPTAIRSHALLVKNGLLKADGTLTDAAKELPLYTTA